MQVSFACEGTFRNNARRRYGMTWRLHRNREDSATRPSLCGKMTCVTVRNYDRLQGHAGTVLGGRRRGRRPRSPKDERNDGRQRGRLPWSPEDEGNDRRWRGRLPRSPEDERNDGNDESNGVAGHGRPRTDKSTKCQRGCDKRSPKL